MKKIYIVLSKTPTNTGKIIRAFTGSIYNHAAISLDRDLTLIYGFARENYHTPFLAKLVHESFTTYTLNRNSEVPIALYEIKLTNIQYDHIKYRINEILNDPEIKYNLFSALSFPFIKGIESYKAYTCSEFVVSLLHEIGFKIDKPCCKYTPDDLSSYLEEYLIYKGDIRNVMKEKTINLDYFNKVDYRKKVENYSQLYKCVIRKFNDERL